MESTPDTVITLTVGEKLMVKEGVDEVIQATIAYRQLLNRVDSVKNLVEEGR